MVNVGFSAASFSTLAGLFLVLLGLLIPVLAIVALVRNPRRTENVIGLVQDIALALVYLVCGGILFFQGWRQDPSMQFAQILMTLAIAYLSLKDLLLRFKR